VFGIVFEKAFLSPAIDWNIDRHRPVMSKSHAYDRAKPPRHRYTHRAQVGCFSRTIRTASRNSAICSISSDDFRSSRFTVKKVRIHSHCADKSTPTPDTYMGYFMIIPKDFATNNFPL
jgi:hypothetical protein